MKNHFKIILILCCEIYSMQLLTEISISSKHIRIKVPYHVHTVHHHHIKKYPVYKKIEVPVYKEVKGEKIVTQKIIKNIFFNYEIMSAFFPTLVPFPVHVPIKVP